MTGGTCLSPRAAGFVAPQSPRMSTRRCQQAFTPLSVEVPMQTPRQGQARTGFSVDELHVGIGSVDPIQEPLRSQILTKLGLPQSTTIERLAGNCGGCNEGLWKLQDVASRTSFVLKLVRCRRGYGMSSEADRFARIYQEHPTIANDPAIAFPIKAFKCVGRMGDNSHDLIVMRKVSGQSLGDVVAIKCNGGQMSEVMRILKQLGTFLSRFHASYGKKQHGDFQPSNIFYEASSGSFCLIDVADLGQSWSWGSNYSDVAHFDKSLQILSNSFGSHFYSDGKRHFEEGYRGIP